MLSFPQLLIGFESGTVVLWDLKSKKADYRYTYDEVTAVLSRYRSCCFFSSQQLLKELDFQSLLRFDVRVVTEVFLVALRHNFLLLVMHSYHLPFQRVSTQCIVGINHQ